MPLIYITGASASGKSTVRRELTKRGFEAHDADEDGIASWYHKETGERVERPGPMRRRTREWLAAHEWRMSRGRVEQLADRARDRLVFLCGVSENEGELRNLFRAVVCLAIDEPVLEQRLAMRRSSDFGKAPAERAHVLGRLRSSEETNRELGALTIDATWPVARIVDEILNRLAPDHDG